MSRHWTSPPKVAADWGAERLPSWAVLIAASSQTTSTSGRSVQDRGAFDMLNLRDQCNTGALPDLERGLGRGLGAGGHQDARQSGDCAGVVLGRGRSAGLAAKLAEFGEELEGGELVGVLCGASGPERDCFGNVTEAGGDTAGAAAAVRGAGLAPGGFDLLELALAQHDRDAVVHVGRPVAGEAEDQDHFAGRWGRIGAAQGFQGF